MSRPRILIAGIGNIFLGDDGFGVEVVQALARRSLPEEVRVVDFGTRGLDLAYALTDGYETAILVDAAPRGEMPGTLYVLAPDIDNEPAQGETTLEMHALDPVKVLRLARRLGGPLPRLFVVGCEPTPAADSDDMRIGLSKPVRASVDEAVRMVESLVASALGENASVTPAATPVSEPVA